MDPTEFGRLVALGQDYALGEALATNAQNADRYVDRLCDEAQKLSARPTMPTPGAGKRDAAELMAPLMDYEKPLHDPPGRLHLSEERRKRLADYGNAWMVKITDRDLEGLDFAWLSSLAAFDHWTLLGAGPLRDQSFSDFFTSPIPNYGVLQQWAKLRYAAGLRRGDLPAASAEVRHLADLVRSQRILIAEMVAVALYRLDARAREIAAASGADLSTWPAVDPAQLDRQRRLGFASMYFTYPGVSPETLRKAVRCMSAPCSALVEGVGAHRAFGAYGMTDNLALLAQLAQEQGCESAVFERVRNSREVPAGEALEALSSEVDRQLPKLLGSPH